MSSSSCSPQPVSFSFKASLLSALSVRTYYGMPKASPQLSSFKVEEGWSIKNPNRSLPFFVGACSWVCFSAELSNTIEFKKLDSTPFFTMRLSVAGLSGEGSSTWRCYCTSSSLAITFALKLSAVCWLRGKSGEIPPTS